MDRMIMPNIVPETGRCRDAFAGVVKSSMIDVKGKV